MTERGELLIGPPDGSVEIDRGMSNFDHTVDEGLDAALRAGGVFARHSAWDFNGLVWFSDGQFHEQVWTYHVPRETLSADTLDELMRVVNNAWGWG